MNNILLITPPDVLYNNTKKIFLFCPDNNLKKDIQIFFANCNAEFTIFLYDEFSADINWVMNIFSISDFVLINLDNLPQEIKYLESYFLSYSKTYFTTNVEIPYRILINKNRFYKLSEIQHIIGGTIEI